MKKKFALMSGIFFSMLLRAQEDATDINVRIDTKENQWYSSPWIWIVGAAVFILLLVALTRRKKE